MRPADLTRTGCLSYLTVAISPSACCVNSGPRKGDTVEVRGPAKSISWSSKLADLRRPFSSITDLLRKTIEEGAL